MWCPVRSVAVCSVSPTSAGMRYKRRGVDNNGNVANYVETEQLIHVHNHTLSFVQTRGSVPVFWSQVGYRYNPRPRLDKGERLKNRPSVQERRENCQRATQTDSEFTLPLCCR